MAAASNRITNFAGLVPPPEAYERPRASVLYRVWLIPATLMMLALPVVYGALVIGAGLMVYYHATHNFSAIMSWSDGSHSLGLWMIEMVAYLAPLFAGCVILFLMLKPFFARGPKHHPYSLNPAVEHELYAFVAKICQTVGAPIPERIDLDCDLNASASFRRGLRSFFAMTWFSQLGFP